MSINVFRRYNFIYVNTIQEMKSEMSILHRFPSLNFLPLHSPGIYFLPCIFRLPKINKKTRTEIPKFA